MDWVTRRNTRHVGGRVESYVHLRVSHGVPFIRADQGPLRAVKRVEALNRVKEFKLVLARNVMHCIVNASSFCTHVPYWLHFL
jgi:hypothetical protein